MTKSRARVELLHPYEGEESKVRDFGAKTRRYREIREAARAITMNNSKPEQFNFVPITHAGGYQFMRVFLMEGNGNLNILWGAPAGTHIDQTVDRWRRVFDEIDRQK